MNCVLVYVCVCIVYHEDPLLAFQGINLFKERGDTLLCHSSKVGAVQIEDEDIRKLLQSSLKPKKKSGKKKAAKKSAAAAKSDEKDTEMTDAS